MPEGSIWWPYCFSSFWRERGHATAILTLKANWFTPFAVHYEKMRNHLRETAINSAKIHSLAQKYEHLRINQIQ